MRTTSTFRVAEVVHDGRHPWRVDRDEGLRAEHDAAAVTANLLAQLVPPCDVDGSSLRGRGPTDRGPERPDLVQAAARIEDSRRVECLARLRASRALHRRRGGLRGTDVEQQTVVGDPAVHRGRLLLVQHCRSLCRTSSAEVIIAVRHGGPGTLHGSSFDNMRRCVKRHVFSDQRLRARPTLQVLDVGGADVNGSYRRLFGFMEHRYVVADIDASSTADVLVGGDGVIPVDDGSVDVAVCGQTFEHRPGSGTCSPRWSGYFAPDGVLILIAPSAGPVHRYPVDCYRFHPDSFQALADLHAIHLVELRVDDRGPFRDVVGVFRKQPAAGGVPADSGRVPGGDRRCAPERSAGNGDLRGRVRVGHDAGAAVPAPDPRPTRTALLPRDRGLRRGEPAPRGLPVDRHRSGAEQPVRAATRPGDPLDARASTSSRRPTASRSSAPSTSSTSTVCI